MNKRIDFTNLGGLPIDQDSLGFMQSSYREAFGAIAGLCGNKTILTGVQVVGSNVSAGWISYNSELIPFLAGGLSADVFIEETATSVTFQDNTVRDVEFTKIAKCGTPGTFPFSDLKRLNTLQEMWLPSDVKEVDCTAEYITANFDGTGLGINERRGWAVCNGNNGTKNRGGRVSVGYDSVTLDPVDNVWDAIYNTIGAPGGEKRHKLTKAELPHVQLKSGMGNNKSGIVNDASITDPGPDPTGTNPIYTEFMGDDTPHENRQPFIVTLFIQKL